MPTKKKKKASGSLVRLPHERISIDFVILADAAQEAGGKLYVLGGGWTIHHARQYPSPLPFGLAIGLLIPWNETNRSHDFQFVIRESEERKEIARGGGNFEAGREPGIPAGMTQRIIVAMSGQLLLPAPGTYEVVATVPGDEKRISFEALPVTAKQP